MLSTNELGGIIEVVAPAATNFLLEVLSSFMAIAIPVLIAFWRRSAIKSKLQRTMIEALVRGIEKSTENMDSGDTAFVKRTVKSEAQKAGVEPQVQKIVDQVTKETDEQNARDGKNGG